MNVFDIELLSQQVGECLLDKQAILATAESCTGGGISQAITGVAGSSQWFDRAFITYSNQAKHEMLNVSHETLNSYGAVSEQTAKEMVEGALANSSATIAVAVTGIAGPTGAVEGKPVGTVCFGIKEKSLPTHAYTLFFSGTRQQIRQQAVIEALNSVHKILKKVSS